MSIDRQCRYNHWRGRADWLVFDYAINAMGVDLILSVDALEPRPSGIARYNWALASRVGAMPEVASIRFYRSGHWIADPAVLVRSVEADAKPRRLSRDPRPRWWRVLSHRRFARGHLFHAPNYFLPEWAERGIVTLHDLSVLRYPETHPADRVAYFERHLIPSLARAAHVITVSETIRQEAIGSFSLDPARVTAIYNGVESIFHPRSAEELAPVLGRYGLMPGAYALCVSTIEPRKRVPQLLRAWSLLPADLRERTPLVLVGARGWLGEEADLLIADGLKAGWLLQPGFVPDADLPLLYAGSALFLYPSIYEGFGLPPAEAMASGVPVVAASASCLPEVTDGAAMLVEPDDVEDFALRIERALTDDGWRMDARTRGLAVAKRYDWDRCARATAAVYGRVG
ncbi:MAG: glycosyltransferase family 1 protein [Sphingobium sp.]